MKRSRFLILLLLILILGCAVFFLSSTESPKPPGPHYTIREIPETHPVGSFDQIKINNLGHIVYPVFTEHGVVARLWGPEIASHTIGATNERLRIIDLNDHDLVAGSRRVQRPYKDYPHTRALVWSATNGVTELGLPDELRSMVSHVANDGRIFGWSENKNGEEAYIIWHAEGADLERLPETDWDSRRIEIVSERMSLPRNFSSEAERRRERGFGVRLMGANGKQAVGILHPPGSILDRVSERILKSNSRTTEVIRDLLRTVGVLNRRSDLQVAFVWENHYFFDLNDCIPEDRGWEKIRLVADINDQGQIVGVGKKDGRDKLFLLTPIEKANEPNAHP